jgi:hypothetical protein
MGKIIKLTESDLVRIVNKVISEQSGWDKFNSFKNKLSPIFDVINPYLESGLVTVKDKGGYIVVDVESPSEFKYNGYDETESKKIKDKLKKLGFQSIGAGEYALYIRD